MHFKINKEFHDFCKLAGISQLSGAAYKLYNLAETHGVLSQTDDLYGALVSDCLEDDTAAAKVITEFTGQVCTVALFDAFMHLTIVGEGNCPECGSEDYEWWENDYDYDEETGQKVYSTRYRCKKCDKIFTL